MEARAVPRVAPAGVAALASPGLLRLLSDDRLVALIRDGNTNAFEAVYDRHYRAILSFCRHMLGCADEAEDAVQHTFLAAYNDLVSSRKPIRLRAWLFTIARNHCLSILRARRERTALAFEERATDGLAIQVQRRQDLRDLVVDINHLPEDQRAALVLAEMGALSHDEIGSVLGVPKDKVKALIFQARESLLADRTAREADCREIREQLSTMRGAALRRTTLRRHLRGCQGCREYRHMLERQRRRIAVILPVAPTIALRDAIVGLTAGGGIAGAGVAGGGLLGASSVLKGAAGKALIAAMVAAAGTTGTIFVVHDLHLPVLARSAPHLVQFGTTSVLGATSAQLLPTSHEAGTPASAKAGAGAGSGLVSASGYHTTTTIAHMRTGPLSNLLSSAWPHERLAKGGGGDPPSATTLGPPDLGSPVTILPSPTITPTLPTVGSPVAPVSGAAAGPYSGKPTLGGPGPGGLSGSSRGAGSGGGGPVTDPGAGGPVGAPGPGPTHAPIPTPVPAPGSDPGTPSGSGSGSGSGSPAGSGSGSPSGSGSGSPAGSGSGGPSGSGSGTGPGPVPTRGPSSGTGTPVSTRGPSSGTGTPVSTRGPSSGTGTPVSTRGPSSGTGTAIGTGSGTSTGGGGWSGHPGTHREGSAR